MIQDKVEIRLHDHSLLRVSRTGAGTVYVEHLAPMSLKDGHGLAVKGSVFLLERDRRALLRLLTSPLTGASSRANSKKYAYSHEQ